MLCTFINLKLRIFILFENVVYNTIFLWNFLHEEQMEKKNEVKCKLSQICMWQTKNF